MNNGRTSRLVDSEATFDVAWLPDISFAEYECKCHAIDEVEIIDADELERLLA